VTEHAAGAPAEPIIGLRWGIKNSFVQYVRRMPDGRAWVGGGAVPVGAYEVVFPPVEAGTRPTEHGAADRFWAFGGDVRFAGHSGLLVVRIAFPVITLRHDTAELTVAGQTEEESARRMPLATLHLVAEPAPEGVERWSSTDVRLTPAGAALFNDVYPAGEVLDPLTLTLPVLDGSDRD
jgi:Htaa protein